MKYTSSFLKVASLGGLVGWCQTHRTAPTARDVLRTYSPSDVKINCFPDRRKKKQESRAHYKDLCTGDCTINALPESDEFIEDGPPQCYLDPEKVFYTANDDKLTWDLAGKGLFSTPWKAPQVLIESYEDFATISFKDSQQRYEVPIKYFPPKVSSEPLVEVDAAKTGHFNVKINRRSDKKLLESLTHGMILEDQYLQLAFIVHARYLAGFGESEHETFIRETAYGTRRYNPIFTRPQGVGQGWDPNAYANLYGAHPFFLAIQNDGSSFGVFIENSNAMEIELAPGPTPATTLLVWRAIGGIAKFHIFGGPTPVKVIQQYHGYIGKPFMPPYWAFGIQLSRYGYADLAEVEKLHDSMNEMELPFDIQTFDIDYMRRQLDFTVDTRTENGHNFDGLDEKIASLKKENRRSVMMFDPAISMGDGMLAQHDEGKGEVAETEKYGEDDGIFMSGLKDEVYVRPSKPVAGLIYGNTTDNNFIKYNKDDALTAIKADELENVLTGKVWPYWPIINKGTTCDDHLGKINEGKKEKEKIDSHWDNWVVYCNSPTGFPDWFKSETQEWWKKHITDFKKTYHVDAMWIDMNEPENFVSGSVSDSAQCQTVDGKDYNDPPYKPRVSDFEQPLHLKTLCMDSLHTVDGKDELHYNVHSLYGYKMSEVTRKVTDDDAVFPERTFVFGRSTYPGTGHYAGHWLGDNTSDYKHMRCSTIGMVEFSMFGIPYNGADICGFFGNTSETLCFFWSQLGAFYPFSRNHNGIGSIQQDPASFGKPFADGVKPIFEMRYQLAPYLYNLFIAAHKNGEPVLRNLILRVPP